MELALQSDELFQIMKGRMTTEHEQIFMASHYLYLEHGTDNTKFVVDFDDVWKNVDFTQKANAKRLLEKHFTEKTDYVIVFFPKEELLQGQLGGRPKETIMLTVDCFKNFCMVASTPKAKVIRSYYIKMENIMHEYYKNFKIKNEVLQNALDISVKETAIKRHEVLIESNKNKWVVYFCRIRLNDDGSFILKIGESTDIKNRIEALSCDFDTSIIVLDVFNCENSLRFERFLHNSKELVKYKYNHLEHKNKTLSTEAYHIPTLKEYEKLIKFAKTELSKYNSMELMKLRIEEKRIDMVAALVSICKNHDEVMSILEKITSPITCNIESPKECITITKQEEKEKSPELEENGPTANSTGPIVQIYHKDNLQKVVRVFSSIIEATRDFDYDNKTASFTCIKKANQHKTLYLDHRWHFISNRQEIDLHKPRDIGETVLTQERKQGQVAMLNIDKTKIISVFKMAKEAAKSISQHPSALCTAIKYMSPLNNHYWLHWENVSVALRNDFLKTNILPVREPNIRGVKIDLLCIHSNEIVQTFNSYTDVQKELKVSARKIKELIETNETYKGQYKFRLS
jgi:phage anti-repressor protein